MVSGRGVPLTWRIINRSDSSEGLKQDYYMVIWDFHFTHKPNIGRAVAYPGALYQGALWQYQQMRRPGYVHGYCPALYLTSTKGAVELGIQVKLGCESTGECLGWTFSES